LILFSLIGNFILFVLAKIDIFFLIGSFFLTILISFLWWKDVSRERLVGYHTHKLESSLRVGILFFILSEVFFFVSFFWGFYDASLRTSIELGLVWPPCGVTPLLVYSVPLLNTIILLTRGISVTWAHHSIIRNFFIKSFLSLFFTVFLGVYFLYTQFVEYSEAQFCISDGVYGSTFFIATGFHGVHVLVGTIFLSYSLLNLLNIKLLFNHHFSFEAAAWYWHFVDVVWLFVFCSIYWFGGHY